MMLLTATTTKLKLTTATDADVDVVADYVDITSTGYTPGQQRTKPTTATTTDIVDAPAASTTRQIKTLSIRNVDTSAQTVTVILDDSGTEYQRHKAVLQVGEALYFGDTCGWVLVSANGRPAQLTNDNAPTSAFARSFLKVGSTSEAAGQFHFLGLSAGGPGAWAPGSPGLTGRATDGTTSNDAGCIPLTSGVGSMYVVAFVASLTTIHAPVLWDILWVNSGIVVTTTTAQSTATAAALPARDANGTSNGEDVWAALLVSAATTNAAAITNCTISYTNSDGTAGRTGTMASFPATAALGTFVPFQLQAGDKGVRSIESITLGTSMVTGTVHLVLYREVAKATAAIANVNGAAPIQRGGVRIYDGSCLLPGYYASTTTATNMSGWVNVEVR